MIHVGSTGTIADGAYASSEKQNGCCTFRNKDKDLVIYCDRITIDGLSGEYWLLGPCATDSGLGVASSIHYHCKSKDSGFPPATGWRTCTPDCAPSSLRASGSGNPPTLHSHEESAKNATAEAIRMVEETKASAQAKAKLKLELQQMHTTELHYREASATNFYFLHASKICSCSFERLPRLQDLKRAHPDLIVKKPVDMTSSLLGVYRENMLGVSHRWEQPDEPDTHGKQFATLKRYLADHPKIEFVWFDFPCMPQKPRTPEEDEEFAEMLSNVNAIFIGMQVLVLLDMSYMSRFWTQTEAWMSMQDASASGLATASQQKRRYTIIPLHNASAKLSETLVDMWAGKSAQEAHDILAQPDVLVTNQSDKERQLPKILKLNQTTQQIIVAHTKRESALQELVRAMAAKDGSALTAAVSDAEKADVAPTNLDMGRMVLAAIQVAQRDRQQVLQAFAKAQQVASEAVDHAQQLAKDIGAEVKLSSRGSTLSITIRTESDGNSDSLNLKKVSLEPMLEERATEERIVEATKERIVGATEERIVGARATEQHMVGGRATGGEGACCLVQ